MSNDGGVDVDAEVAGGSAGWFRRLARVVAWTIVILVVVGGLLAGLAVGFVLFAMSNGGNRVEGISIENRTDDDLTIVYLVGGRQTDDGVVVVPGESREVDTVMAHRSTLLDLPSPARESCTVAPLVARRADGSEVSRLHAGICTNSTLVEWTID